MDKIIFLRAVLVLFIGVYLTGCATSTKSKSGETQAEELDAAQKVLGAMGNKDVSREDLKAVATDIQKNEASRSAAQKILGVGGEVPVVKYSPVTGKHYSGDLEFDPETGVKLEVVHE